MANTYTNSLETQRNEEINVRKIYTHDGSESMEFGNSEIHSFKLVNVSNYFEGCSELEVQRHFEKAFFNSMAGKQQIGNDILLLNLIHILQYMLAISKLLNGCFFRPYLLDLNSSSY